MSSHAAHAAPPRVNPHETAGHIRQAIAIAGREFPGARQTERDIADVLTRFDAANTSTVIALVGGSGSGKSTIMNALAGRAISTPGARRPTTTYPVSVQWGDGGETLLDRLGVTPRRRHSMVLHDDEMDGVILVDMPDEDTSEQSAQLLDDLLGEIDILVWVVDPIKYADGVLHERFLAKLTERRTQMVAVINKADSLTAEELTIVKNDMRRLLDEAQLDMPILVTSAPTGDGIKELRSTLSQMRVSAGATATAQTLLKDIARDVADRLGGPVEPAAADSAVDGLIESSGVQVVHDAIVSDLSSLTTAQLETPEAPDATTVAVVGSAWARSAEKGLPKPWAAAVGRDIAGVDEVTVGLEEALRGVTLPPSRIVAADRWLIGGAVVAVIGVVAAILLRASVLLWVGVGLAAAGIAAAAWSMSLRTKEAKRHADVYVQRVRLAVGDLVERTLGGPANAVIARRQSAQDEIAAVLNE